MKIIIGLGNPGLKYKFSRHNIGFTVVERLARAHGIKIKQRSFNCLLGTGRISGMQVILGLPLTFMNLSAEAVVPLVRSKKAKPENLLIICDDVNLPLGLIRIRGRGSAGGHKGLISIIESLGSRDFPRLRVGVDKPPCRERGGRLSGYVLSGFNRKQAKAVDEAVEQAVDCCRLWLSKGLPSAMNRFNKKVESRE